MLKKVLIGIFMATIVGCNPVLVDSDSASDTLKLCVSNWKKRTNVRVKDFSCHPFQGGVTNCTALVESRGQNTMLVDLKCFQQRKSCSLDH